MTVTEQTAIAPSVFVVDDEPVMRMLARVFLERGGFNVGHEAEDGHKHWSGSTDLHPPPIPSVVLLDNRMPGLTGLEQFGQSLAEQDVLARRTRAVATLSSLLSARWWDDSVVMPTHDRPTPERTAIPVSRNP